MPIYTSDDSGSPVITDAFSLADAIKACLVDGYTGHAAAGWAIPFENATYRVFRPNAGNRYFLQVGKATAQQGQVRGYSSMSAVTTGVDPFPATINANFNSYWETGPGTTPKPWVIAADSRTMHIFIDSALGGIYVWFTFGDIFSFKPGDAHGVAMTAVASQDTNPFKTMPHAAMGNAVGNSGGNIGYRGLGKTYLGTGTWVDLSWTGDLAKQQNINQGLGRPWRGDLPYPNPAGSGLWLAPVYVSETGGISHRGRFRGMWHWLHNTAGVANKDTFAGTGDFTGKNFRIIKAVANATDGLYVIEDPSTWETN